MKTYKLISFKGDATIKAKHIARLKKHYDLDEIIQGKYWENGKGCDTGCTFHSDDHSLWAKKLGIPEQIGYLRDAIFEGLPANEAKEFPLACSNATPVGVDLDSVWRKFFIWLLTDPTDGLLQYAKNDNERKAIQRVAALYTRSLTEFVSEADWWTATETTGAAWTAAGATAWATAWAAWTAAGATAWATAGVVGVAREVALDAARAARAARAAVTPWAARAAARVAHYTKMAAKLIELLKNAK